MSKRHPPPTYDETQASDEPIDDNDDSVPSYDDHTKDETQDPFRPLTPIEGEQGQETDEGLAANAQAEADAEGQNQEGGYSYMNESQPEQDNQEELYDQDADPEAERVRLAANEPGHEHEDHSDDVYGYGDDD